MAFQTSVLRDGEWVTETANFQAALEQATASTVAAATEGPDIEGRSLPVACGILSRTIVDSPVACWILPVRLRSETHNDVAFIGEHFVQINELRGDGQMHQIVRKSDFGARIRNAVVLGDPLQHGLDDENSSFAVEPEGSDCSMPDATVPATADASKRCLPPQLLVLMLESGDAIFLFLRRQPDKSLDFVLARHTLAKKIPYMGFHLAVDPSSRYMASASADGLFVTYELEAMSALNAQYQSRGTFTPVKAVRLRSIHGVIHKLGFLYPQPTEGRHIILILLVVRNERNLGEPVTRMLNYEWEVGDDLKSVFAAEKVGYRLPKEHEMPLLFIPLKFNNSFFIVSSSLIGIVKDCLTGSPVFESLRTDAPSQTGLFHGTGSPIWTAWARPFRHKGYFERTDIIYLGREDGVIVHVEMEATDLVPSVTNVGCLDSNINTAFATAYDTFSDILIIGGDSGPGGIWKLAPRTELEQVSVLPNWSPVIDATATVRHAGNAATATGTGGTQSATARQSSLHEPWTQPDTLFTVSGRGVKGSVTQWRWGVQARIGLEVESGEPVRQSWVLTLRDGERRRLHALLSLPYSSLVLRFSENFDQVDSLGADDSPFDLASRTLAACETAQGGIVQVTERTATSIRGGEITRVSFEELLGPDVGTVDNAFVADDTVVISSHGRRGSQLHTFSLAVKFNRDSTWDVQGETTCVSLLTVSNRFFVVAGSMLDGNPWLSVYTLNGSVIASQRVSNETGIRFEALTSLCAIHQDKGEVHIAAGTRCGHLLNIKLPGQESEEITWTAETIGLAPVEVSLASSSFNGTGTALMCCDNALTVMTDFSKRDGKFRRKHAVWLTDANDASMPSPPVHSVCSLKRNLSRYSGHLSLMVQAGSRLLLAETWPHVGLVPRSIPIEGTPTRIIYSQTWDCLVIALLKHNQPTLAFVDAESGEIISVPSDKDGNASEFISGLGHVGDRIYGLHEWLYTKAGKTFSFILVATKDGRLLIVSVNKMKSRPQEGQATRLHYWTRHKKVIGRPIYSVVGDDQGIVFCADRTLHWEVLDLVEKRLKPMGKYELDSAAISLRLVHGTIFALTTMHSLEIIGYRYMADGNEGMALMHSDRVSRRTVHMMSAGCPTDRHGRWPVTLLSDQKGGFAGIRIPWGQHGKEFATVFEGALPQSVRRFVGARSRPFWLAGEGHDVRFGTLPSGSDGVEIFGFSLNGSLQHFTLIGIQLWRFLHLIQKMASSALDGHGSATATVSIKAAAEGVKDMRDETGGDDEGVRSASRHPTLMHIDGDMIERCCRRCSLGQLVGTTDGFILFCQYLDGLDGGRHTQGFRSEEISESVRRERYLALGDEILEYLFRPVI
ncbi:thermotolerance protein [Drechmeria coniospora]|uniref:Thermotolerance protein n=1 Tax=Drechmeria coniospora TaxID=98403 RepID=A0A151GRE5_DRECN|nr:thermotolerance protein [Drechmeria coniospora]KYK59685.1 thermotolerance protein [Drechmeria coniospora]